MKKAQAAIEFLTTYGWAILIIIVSIGAFSYYIGFDTQSKIPNRCDLGFDFSCGGYMANSSGILIFEFTNNIGKTINLSFIRIDLPNDIAQILDYRNGEDSVIPPGGKVLVRTFPNYCSNQYKLFTFDAQKEKFPIKIYYIFANELEELAKVTSGEIIVDILKSEIDMSFDFNDVNNLYIIEEKDETKWTYPIEDSCTNQDTIKQSFKTFN